MQLNTIKKMERHARQDATIVSLGQGIPGWPSDERIRRAVTKQILAGNVDHYSDPQGMDELRDALSKHLRIYDMAYSQDEIIVTAGAIEALGVAVRSVVHGSRSHVITATPVYSAYFKLIELAGGKVVEVALDESDGWSLDAEKVIAAMNDNTAAVLLCHPNNPTGTVYPAATLRRITRAAKQRGVTVIIDEVYRNMMYDDVAFYSPASEPAFHDTVIRVMSFSKDFALTGWRVGYLHASQERIAAMLGIHDTLVNCTPVVSQYAALAALGIHNDVTMKNAITYARNRDYVAKRLDELSEFMTYTMPQGGYFFFPKLCQEYVSGDIVASLLRSGVVTIPGAAFGSGMDGYLRICFGRDERNLTQGMDRFVRYFKQLVVE